MESVDFGRKINYVPMYISWGAGILVGLLFFIFTKVALLSIILGITALVVVALIYAWMLADFYGYWELSETGIKYFNYQNFSVRFQSVLFPFSEATAEFKYTDVKKLTVVVGKDMNAPANILGGSFYAPKKIMFHLPTPYYLDLQLNDGREVNLDLSADWEDSEIIEYVIAIICSEADIEAGIVKQENSEG